MSSGVPRINRASNVPRPPHPINPTRSLSFAPKTRSADTAVQAAIPALTEFFTNSRRFIGVPRIFAVCTQTRGKIKEFQVLLYAPYWYDNALKNILKVR